MARLSAPVVVISAQKPWRETGVIEAGKRKSLTNHPGVNDLPSCLLRSPEKIERAF